MLVLSACTAGWGSMVRYSSAPAPREESAELGLYRVVVGEYGRGDTGGLHLVRPADVPDPPLVAVTSGGPAGLPGYWADSLKREALLALQDPARGKEPTWGWLEQAMALEGVRLRSGERERTPVVRKLRLTRPGFNADSTVGAIDVDFWCGLACGAGETLLLARRPGRRWRIWYRQVRWIS
ncbi:MAG TPA: hypothetical protein VF046_03785 [Gemmatimonadales bacterium]